MEGYTIRARAAAQQMSERYLSVFSAPTAFSWYHPFLKRLFQTRLGGRDGHVALTKNVLK